MLQFKFSSDLLQGMSVKGKLKVYYGCMFSGKTSSLINYISAQNLKSSEFIVLKPSEDNRSGNSTITTHDGKNHACLIYSQDFDIFEHITPFTKLLAIDEAQFFNKVFLSDIKKVLLKGIDIVVSGLDKDYLGRPFGLIPSLIEISDEKNHLKAYCFVCGKDAEFTYRKADNKVLVLIGNDNYYEPRCKECFEL